MKIGYRVRALMLMIFLAVATGVSAQDGGTESTGSATGAPVGSGVGTGPGLCIGQPSQAADAPGTGLAK